VPCVGIFQASLEILADHLEDLWLSVQEIGNFLEILVHVDARWRMNSRSAKVNWGWAALVIVVSR